MLRVWQLAKAKSVLLTPCFLEIIHVCLKYYVRWVPHAQLMEAPTAFFMSLYGQPPGTSMESAHFKLFTKKTNTPKLMALLLTTANHLQHTLHANLQVMLLKAAKNQTPPPESTDVTQFLLF